MDKYYGSYRRSMLGSVKEGEMFRFTSSGAKYRLEGEYYPNIFYKRVGAVSMHKIKMSTALTTPVWVDKGQSVFGDFRFNPPMSEQIKNTNRLKKNKAKAAKKFNKRMTKNDFGGPNHYGRSAFRDDFRESDFI